jgi:Ca2+-binding EF-hand superfamily protein
MMHARAFLAFAVPAFLAALAPISSAQTRGSSALLQAWDSDHDGTLSLDEVKSAASDEFDKLDTDHDGTLSSKELGTRLSHHQFGTADADHDGTLSKDEYLAVVERRFQAADADHDGTLDGKELSSGAGRRLARLLQ